MVETNNRDVKSDPEVEVLDVANTPEEGDEDDEEVIPPVEEEENPDKKESASDTSPDEDEEPDTEEKDGEDEAGEEPADPQDPPQEPSKPAKPVQGETAREKALRIEVQNLRALVRKDSQTKMFSGVKVHTKSIEERMKSLHDNYSEDEIRNMEEAIDVLAQKRGYVKAEDNWASDANKTVSSFVNDHPEYKPSNDKDDIRWGAFTRILESDYNVKGKSPEQLAEILKKVHKDVVAELGDPNPEVARETRKTAAQQQKIKSVSHSGGTRTPPKPKESVVDPSVRSHFKGFDDEDFEE